MKTYKATINWQWKDKAGNDQVTSETIELSEARLKQLIIDVYDGWYSEEDFPDWESIASYGTLHESFNRIFKEEPFGNLDIYEHYEQVPSPADVIINDYCSVGRAYDDKYDEYDNEDMDEFNSPERVAEFIDEILDEVDSTAAEAKEEE